MADIASLPPMTPSDAAAIGFATFNLCPHLAVDIPDGGFTITTKTNDGRTVTFHFGVYREGGPPTFLDIQYHSSGSSVPDGSGDPAPIFDMLTISKGGANHFDSRKMPAEKRPSIACILLEPLAEGP